MMFCAKCKSDITDKTKIHKNKLDKIIYFTKNYLCVNCYIKYLIFFDIIKD